MPLHDMEHAVDPADVIRKRVGDRAPSCPGFRVLVATYHRPQKTSSGIILTDRIREEDSFQSKTFLVLAVGENAYKSDEYRKFETPWCKPGDWIIASRPDVKAFGLSVTKEVQAELGDGIAEQHLGYISDDKVLGVVPGPNGYL